MPEIVGRKGKCGTSGTCTPPPRKENAQRVRPKLMRLTILGGIKVTTGSLLNLSKEVVGREGRLIVKAVSLSIIMEYDTWR